MDFKDKNIVPTEKAKMWYVPANRHITILMRKKFPEGCTFKEFKKYCEENYMLDKHYWFDGRKSSTVLYEPLELNAAEFAAIMENNYTISTLLQEINYLHMEIEHKTKTDKRLVDIAINQLENTLNLLKKC